MGPGHESYDALRGVFNGAIDRRPALIARPRDVEDVRTLIVHAREEGLDLTVRGGGHSIAGHAVADGGVCLDLRSLTRIEMDPHAGRVRVQAGVTWGELDRATARAGLLVPGGRAESTGVAGVTLGSGSGWFERVHGLSADSLQAAEVVTADGRFQVASPRDEADLFWGLCGGGGNLAVVTRLEFRLYPAPALFPAGMLLFDGARAGELIEGFYEVLSTAPDELAVMLGLLTAPDADWVPEQFRGRLAVMVIGGWLGAPDDGERVLGRLRALAPLALDTIRPTNHHGLQQLLTPGPAGALRHYWTADCLSDLSTADVDALVTHAAGMPSKLSQTLLMPGGGALQQPRDPTDPEETLLAARLAPWSVHVVAMWSDPAEDQRQRDWVHALRSRLAPQISGRNYLNFADDHPEALRVALGPRPYARLAELKHRHDPTNLFRHNPSVALPE